MKTTLTSTRQSHCYCIHGITIACDVSLPELEQVRTASVQGTPGMQITHALAVPADAHPSPHWFLSMGVSDRTPWLQCATTDRGYLLRIRGQADFVIDRAGRHIEVRTLAPSVESTLRHLLLDQVIPMVLTLQGLHALHATAVLTPRGVVAFLGRSGSGKSTLAASLARDRFPILADDCLVLEIERNEILGRPAYPGVRLWDDALALLPCVSAPRMPVSSGSAKHRVQVPAERTVFQRRYPLAALYVLTWGEQVRPGVDPDTPALVPCTPREAVMHLMASVFRLDTTDHRRLGQELDFLSTLAERVPVTEVVVPDRLDALPLVRDLIVKNEDSP